VTSERDPTTINIMGAKLPVGLFLIGVAVVLISGLLLWYLRDAPRAAEAGAVRERLESFTAAVVSGDGEAACAMMSDPSGFAAGFPDDPACPAVIGVIGGSFGADRSEILVDVVIGDVRIFEETSGTDTAEAAVAGERIDLVRARGCDGSSCWMIVNPEALLQAIS